MMRNFSVLILPVLATLGLWQIWNMVLFGCFLPPMVAETTILDISLAMILSIAILGGWIYFVARLGPTLFAGANARRFRVAAVAIVCFLAVWLIWTLHIALQPAQRISN